MKKSLRKLFYWFIFINCLIISWILISDYLIKNGSQTCAYVTKITGVRFTDYVNYEFEVDGKIINGSSPLNDLKIQSHSSLSELKCIEVRYIENFPSLNAIYDKRLRTD